MCKNKFIFIYLFTGARVENKKYLSNFFSVAMNFYQRQSWNYSSSNIHWHQSQEYYKQIIIA
jgi:hypothetical protein